MFKSGFVALVGRPNAGKSTLLNALIGEKLAIATDVSQTTRHRIRGILNKPKMQAIFIDTPGLHKPYDVLGQELNESAFQAIGDVDVVCFVVDATKPIGKGDEWVINQIGKRKKICIINKSDLSDPATINSQVDKAKELAKWDALVVLSSKTGDNTAALIEEVERLLPEGPAWFPKDAKTDQILDTIVAEYIREKIITNVFDEIPHGIGVEIDDIEEGKKIYKIYASAYCERENHKGMIIGKGGQNIKRIGSEARKDLEKLLGKKVFLDLSIKVRPNWRRDYNQVRRFGYSVE